jgi:ribonuclease HI
VTFTDGACRQNGKPEARAGAGVAFSNRKENNISSPITDEEDNYPVRTSQRAELYAVKLALLVFQLRLQDAQDSNPGSCIIATDSEYVVKGITTWLPTWKVSMSN